MSLTGRLISLVLKLPSPDTRDVAVDRDLPVSMPDGAILLADHYYPRNNPRPPTVLIRTPYGRVQIMGRLLALLVDRGQAPPGPAHVPLRRFPRLTKVAREALVGPDQLGRG